jgi:hypothetical protein
MSGRACTANNNTERLWDSASSYLGTLVSRVSLGGCGERTKVETIEPKWNAESKDRLEQLVCDLVCNGRLDLATAQEAFARDWIAAYRKYYEGQ